MAEKLTSKRKLELVRMWQAASGQTIEDHTLSTTVRLLGRGARKEIMRQMTQVEARWLLSTWANVETHPNARIKQIKAIERLQKTGKQGIDRANARADEYLERGDAVGLLEWLERLPEALRNIIGARSEVFDLLILGIGERAPKDEVIKQADEPKLKVIRASLSGGYSEALEYWALTVRNMENPHFEAAVQENIKARLHSPVDREDMRFEWRTRIAHLKAADPFFISTSICRLFEEITKEEIPGWALYEDMLLTKFGFCWFEQAFDSLDVGEEFAKLAAISWGILYAKHVPESNQTEMSSAPIPGGFPICQLVSWWGPGATYRRAVVPITSIAIPINRTLDGWNEAPDDPDAILVLRLFQVLLSFLQQRILVTSREPGDRATRRRLEAAKIEEIPLVRVVALRKKEYAPHEAGDHSEREYSCQWVVRGHWRNQWYPSLQRNQPKWIGAYVKGDPEKPLKPPRAIVFAVVR